MDQNGELIKEKRIMNLTNMGKGRPKGSKNILQADVKQAFWNAFEEMGGIEGLVAWAKKNPNSFYPLVAKMMPTKIEGANSHAGVVVNITGLAD